MKIYDAAVVGAGPAGSTVAALLARRGYRVLLIDRSSFPRDKACAEYCSPGVEDVLRRTGAWAQVASGLQRVGGMMVFVDGSPVLPVTYGSRARSRYAFTTPRRKLDHILFTHAVNSGADVVERVRVTDVERVSDGIRITGITRSPQTPSWTARVIVGADGLHSTVRQSLGIRSKSHWPQRLGLVTHYAGPEPLTGSGEMHVGSGAYCGLAPLADGLINVGLVVSLKVRRGLGESFDSGLASIPGLTEKLRLGTMVKPIRGIGPMSRSVDTVAGTGFLLVGDAAGFLDPFTGEGIFRALRGGELAASVIDRSLHQTASSQLPDLSEYQEARRRTFRSKERLTWLIQFALARPNILAAACQGISRSEPLTAAMGNALGDCGPPADCLSLPALRSLLVSRSTVVDR